MYRNRLWFPILGALVLFSACQSQPGTNTNANASTTSSNFHKVVVQEVLQTSQYTYLRAKESDKEVWLAAPSMQAKAGDTYYYEGGIQMTKFESKELNRVFESIILLEKINTEPKASAVAATNNTTAPAADYHTGTDQQGVPATSEQYTRTPPNIEKKDVKVAAAKGGITIGELFAKKDSYAGKTVKIKGQVTKYTPAVMGKNWIHIQDGTESGGKFDLAITSDAEVNMGDQVTFEGQIGLNKDLGYGYFFDVLMENAKLVK